MARRGSLVDVSAWMACVWGLLGAAAVEAHQLHSDIARVKNYPWRARGEVPLGPYLLALVIRLALGVGLAAIFGASGQAGGPVGVAAVGVAAPKVLEQLAGRGLMVLEARDPEMPTPSATRARLAPSRSDPEHAGPERAPVHDEATGSGADAEDAAGSGAVAGTAAPANGRPRGDLAATERETDDA